MDFYRQINLFYYILKQFIIADWHNNIRKIKYYCVFILINKYNN